MSNSLTLRHFLRTQTQPVEPGLMELLEDIMAACRVIGTRLRNAAFEGNHGLAGDTNVQGEDQKKLDVIADETFAEHCAASPRLAALVSEEQEDATWLKEPESGDYLLYFDPLDGSSNVDVNLSVGSIFSVSTVAKDGDRDLLKPGRTQVCAGYVIYGPAMTLVLTLGSGVHSFSFDQATGEFRLTQRDMTVPRETREFAINTSRYHLWDAPVRRYIDECLSGPNGPRAAKFNMRWTASMVADVHRILSRGGVFMYPADSENQSKGGKLRLMYEANPMGWLIEQAGGIASTGHDRILDIAPKDHHQRVPVILGSAEEVTLIESYHQA